MHGFCVDHMGEAHTGPSHRLTLLACFPGDIEFMPAGGSLLSVLFTNPLRIWGGMA